MKWSFDKPLTIQLGPKALSVVKVRHGVTEATLSDGRLVRLSLHLTGVREDGADKLDFDYSLAAEIVNGTTPQVMDAHETVQ